MDRRKQSGVLAFDFGASSGRAIVGTIDNNVIKATEVYRFYNGAIDIGGRSYWDIDRLFSELLTGIEKALIDYDILSIGIDTWGVDFALLKDGSLIDLPLSYRNADNEGMTSELSEKISLDKLYSITGTQVLDINTVCQLLAIKKNRPELLEKAEDILMMPDLFAYMLTGKKRNEITEASTTSLLNVKTLSWAEDVMEELEINKDLFCDFIYPGEIIGYLKPSICEHLGIEPIPVIAVAGHDTESALYAIPAKEEDYLFLSCGTWSLLGTKLKSPVLSTDLKYDFTNEVAVGGEIAFLQNITGLYVIQELLKEWNAAGMGIGFGDLEKEAAASVYGGQIIDTDDRAFGGTGSMVEGLKSYCERTAQAVPSTRGEAVLVLYRSLAEKYRAAIEKIEALTEKKFNKLYMVGGGSKSALLISIIEEVCRKTVVPSGTEGSALGNIAIQLTGLGLVEKEVLPEILKNSI